MNSRNTYAEVNVNQFLRNIFEISKKCGLQVAPVLKADAYGHGAVELAKACQNHGVGMVIVAFLEEALQLRESGVALPILVLNYFDPKFSEEAILNDLIMTVYSEDQVKLISENLKGEEKLKVHLKVDTGMGRIGLLPDEAVELYNSIAKDPKFVIDGVYTHLSSADDPEDPFNEKQMDDFKSFLSKIKKPKLIHISNSAGATILNDIIGNFCRAGIASYGLQPSSKIKVEYIKPIMSVHSIVDFVKKLSPDRPVGYGHTFLAKSEMRAATIPFGYADGLPRSLSNKGSVLINGKRAKILGRVSMDQIVVDVSKIGDVKVGDDVVIMGESGDESITAEEIAEIAGTINYEIVCGISKRVPRIYV